MGWWCKTALKLLGFVPYNYNQEVCTAAKSRGEGRDFNELWGFCAIVNRQVSCYILLYYYYSGGGGRGKTAESSSGSNLLDRSTSDSHRSSPISLSSQVRHPPGAGGRDLTKTNQNALPLLYQMHLASSSLAIFDSESHQMTSQSYRISQITSSQPLLTWWHKKTPRNST